MVHKDDLLRTIAGFTWWLENLFLLRDDYNKVLNIIQKGPPKI